MKNIKMVLIVGLVLVLIGGAYWLNNKQKDTLIDTSLSQPAESPGQETEDEEAVEPLAKEEEDEDEEEEINLSTEYSSTSGGIEWDSLPLTEVSLDDKGLNLSSPGTYVLRGSSTGQILVNSQGGIRLILDGVEINSEEGPAIYIEEAEIAVIELAENSTNIIEDSFYRDDEEIDGAIYSSDDLIITGTGNLFVQANFKDGIVGKDDLWIEGGNIDVISEDDGIRGKDSLNISGGKIIVDALDDGIKSSNSTDLGKGQLNISGGEIIISAGNDGIKAQQRIWITGGTINIVTSTEGIEAPEIVIDGGDIDIYATDDGINASASDIISSGLNITINGGDLYVEVGSGDTDALDSNGNLTITGGNIQLVGRSAVDFDGIGSFTGGTLIINGQEVSELPNQMMGGPGGQGPGPRP